MADKLARRLPLLAALVLVSLLAVAAPAAAETCTLGVDTARFADRPPSACSYLNAPAPPTGHVTRGPDGAAWFIARNNGFQLMRRSGSQVTLAAGLPLGESPTGIATGPDGALWIVAGSQIVRVQGNDVASFDLPTRAASFPAGATRLTGMVSAGGRLWLPGEAGLVEVNPDGSTLLHLTAGLRPVGGITVAGDGSLWFSAGAFLGRREPNGNVSRVAVSPVADADVSRAPLGEGDIWWGSRGARSLSRLSTSGGIQSFGGLYAAPGDILTDAGRHVVWSTVSEGARHYLVRISTRGFARGRPAGVRCDIRAPISCGVGLRAHSLGERPQFLLYGSPGALAYAADGNLHFGAGPALGQVIPFRGLLPCARLGAVVGRYRASACPEGRWDGFVTNRPVAYARVSCLRLTFRYCAGSLALYYGGRVIGRSTYVVQAYDNPQVRIPVSHGTLSMIKARRSIVATVALRSFDQSGLIRLQRYPILLYPGARDRTP